MQSTVPQLCTDALRLCGQSGRPGRGIGTEQEIEVTRFLNMMFDSWNAMRGSIFTVSIDRYRLDPLKTIYTIGPTGDFVAPRPTRIKAANLVMLNVFPENHLPMGILNDDQWADMVVTEIPTTIPRLLYYDANSDGGNASLYLWGFPTISNDLELFTWQPLATTLTSGDEIFYPDGANLAIVQNLAMLIAPLYWKKTDKMLSLLQTQAQVSRARYSNPNQENPYLISDSYMGNAGGSGWDYYSYLTGGL